MPSRIERFTEALGNRYAVEREIATGGTATVYLANDLRYQRRVAVKVFRPEIAEALGHERFVREIAVVAKLNHPHIVPLLDSGEVEELMYYVMPAVEGESLRERLSREGQLPVDDALQIARDVAVAVDYAHTRNIVHRDIKPENILLTAGAAVVADFGIAKMLNHSSGGNSLTKAGIAVGTVAYMSPEQAAAGPVDGRSDVYALGCVLFEMLAGRPPFTGKTTRAVVAAHFTEPVPNLSALRPEVATSMQLAIAKALAKSPDDRFPTATAFIDEVQAARRSASRERMFKKMGFDEARAILAAEDTKTAAVPAATPTPSSPVPVPPVRPMGVSSNEIEAARRPRHRPIPLIAVVGAVVALVALGWVIAKLV